MVKNDRNLIEDFNFIGSNTFDKYEGMWIAVVRKEVVAVDKNLKKAYSQAREKHPECEPLMDKVIGKKTLIV